MIKTFTFLLLYFAPYILYAQTAALNNPATQEYGKVSQEDLKLKSCDFEKDANAEALFEKSSVYFGGDLLSIIQEVHKRIKIFNDNGKSEADIHLRYYSGDHLEYILGLQAETINLTDGKTEITKVDKKQIYTRSIDKQWSEITFAMPNVKPGCIIEYKYKLEANSFSDFPDWYFQEKIPVRYSEFTTLIPDIFYFRAIPHITYSFSKHTTSSNGRSLVDNSGTFPYNEEVETRAMTNLPSLPDEAMMTSYVDNLQSIRFQLVSIKPIGGFTHSYSETWAKVGGRLEDDEDFGGQLKRKLNGEAAIISKAKELKTDDEKIAYIFGEVKNSMKWNGSNNWYTIDGTYRSWENKTGNSAEINLILYHLLKQSGINAYPMVVSTRDHGRVNAYYTSLIQFNEAVVYVPVDSNKRYVLDASGKYNIYNEIPEYLLNSSGLYIDKATNTYDIVYLHRSDPVRQVVFIKADIKPDGKMTGTAQLSSFGYYRIDAVKRYKTDGEKKYTDLLCDHDNTLKISSVKFENMETDSLPLIQNIDFNIDLPGADESYIYFNSNLFTALHTNPFLSENRFTDIDFGYLTIYSINGLYTIPAGYKIDALPKSVSMSTPDKGVIFRRMVAAEDGKIMIRYTIDYKKAIYHKEDYPDFHEFFKKMHEMLNEQVVLKKS